MLTYFAPLASPGQLSIARRLDAHIDVIGEDWIFRGARSHNGYAIVATYGKRVARAHRVAYEIAFGPVPEGLHVDHVFDAGCRSRACIRPDHLEAVTQAENTARALAARKARLAADLGRLVAA